MKSEKAKVKTKAMALAICAVILTAVGGMVSATYDSGNIGDSSSFDLSENSAGISTTDESKTDSASCSILVVTNSMTYNYAKDVIDALNDGEGTLSWAITADCYLPSELSSVSTFDPYDVALIDGWATLDSSQGPIVLSNSAKFQDFLTDPAKSLVIDWARQDSGSLDITSLLPPGNGNMVINGYYSDSAICYIYPGAEGHDILNQPNTITDDDIDDSWYYGPTRTYYTTMPTGAEEITYRDDNSETTLFVSTLSSGSKVIGAGYVIGDNHFHGYSGGDLEVKLFENILHYAISGAPTVPSISIYTDKTSYTTGDKMALGLNVKNPGEKQEVSAKIWLEVPTGGTFTLIDTYVTLPAGLDYNNPNFKVFPLPGIPDGTYVWHAVLDDPATGEILSEDTAKWDFAGIDAPIEDITKALPPCTTIEFGE